MDIIHSEAVRKSGTRRKFIGAVIPIIRSRSKVNGNGAQENPETARATREQPDDGSSKLKRMMERRAGIAQTDRVVVERPVDQLRVATTEEDREKMGKVNRKTGTVAGGTATEIRAIADCWMYPAIGYAMAIAGLNKKLRQAGISMNPSDIQEGSNAAASDAGKVLSSVQRISMMQDMTRHAKNLSVSKMRNGGARFRLIACEMDLLSHQAKAQMARGLVRTDSGLGLTSRDMFTAQNYDDSAEMSAENFTEASMRKMGKFMDSAESIAGSSLWDLRQGVSASLDVGADDAIYMLGEAVKQGGIGWSDIAGQTIDMERNIGDSRLIKKFDLGNEATGLDLLPTYNMPGSKMKKDSDNTEMHPRKHLLWMMDQVKDVRLISPASVVEMAVIDNAQFAPLRRLPGAAEIARETVTSVDEAMDVARRLWAVADETFNAEQDEYRAALERYEALSAEWADYYAWVERFNNENLLPDDPAVRSQPEEAPRLPVSPIHAGNVFNDVDGFMWWVANDIKARILAARSFQVAVDIEIGKSGVDYIFRDPDPPLTDMYLWASNNVSRISRFFHQGENPRIGGGPVNNPGVHMRKPTTASATDMRQWSRHFQNLRKVSGVMDQQPPGEPNTGMYSMMISERNVPILVPPNDPEWMNLWDNQIDDNPPIKDGRDEWWSLHPTWSPDTTIQAFFTNRLLWVDDRNKTLTYTNTDGNISTLELAAFSPFEARHVSWMMSMTVIEFLSLFNSAINDILRYYISAMGDNVAESYITEEDLEQIIDRVQFDGVPYDLVSRDEFNLDRHREVLSRALAAPTNWVATIQRYANAIEAWINRQGLDTSHPDSQKFAAADGWTPNILTVYNMVDPDNPLLFVRIFGRFLKDAADYMVENQYRYVHDDGYGGLFGRMEPGRAGRLTAVGTSIVLSNAISDRSAVSDQMVEDRARTDPSLRDATDNWDANPVSGSEPGFEFLPQQGMILQALQGMPKFAMLDVDPGGGKTLTALYKCMEMIDSGEIRKHALIICPPNLVNNYVEENQVLTGGRWNLVPLTRDTTQEGYTKYDGPFNRLADMVRMAKTAPRNTIFVTDYLFIKRLPYIIAYGPREVYKYRNIELLEEIGFDLVICDESHMLKNLASATSSAIAKLFTTIPFRYLMTGTFVDKDINDLYAQIQLVDPTIFPTIHDFAQTLASPSEGSYKITGSGKTAKIRVNDWADNWAARLKNRIRDSVAYVTVSEKEWAHTLPNKVETFHKVELTENQMLLYRQLITAAEGSETLDDLASKARNKAVREGTAIEERVVVDEEGADITYVDSTNLRADPHLARLERMLTAPDAPGDLGFEFENEEDQVSPKVAKIDEICREHIAKYPGKIMIWVNNEVSRDHILRHMAEDLKPYTIEYKAGRKTEDVAKLRYDDNIKIMVGIQQSLETGHNFQFCSRIIRLEVPWKPGSQKQGDARIFRPDVHNRFETPVDEETGEKIKFIDWILAVGTIDMVKAARLIARGIISTKYENAEHSNVEIRQAYANINELTVPILKLKRLLQLATNTNLEAYENEYARLAQVRAADHRIARNDPNRINTTFGLAEAEGINTEDDAVLPTMPFVLGQPVPDAFKDKYENTLNWAYRELGVAEEEDGEDDLILEHDDEDMDNKMEKMESERQQRIERSLRNVRDQVLGYYVQTQFGPGIITRTTALQFSVLVWGGSAGWMIKPIPKSKVLLSKPDAGGWAPESIAPVREWPGNNRPTRWPANITRRILNRLSGMKSLQEEIAERTDSNMGTSEAPAPTEIPEPPAPPPAPPPPPAPRPRGRGGRRKLSDLLGERRQWQRQRQQQDDVPETPEILPRSELPAINLYAMAFNNFITVGAWTATSEDEDAVEPEVRDALLSTGKFRDVGPFYYTALNNRRAVEVFWQKIERLEERDKITLPADIRANVLRVVEAFSSGGRQEALRISRTEERDMRSFYLMANRRRGRESNVAVIYMGVEDDTLYAFIDMSRFNRNGGREIHRSIRGQGIEWAQQVQAPFATFTNKQKAAAFIKQLNRDVIRVANGPEIKENLRAIKIRAQREQEDPTTTEKPATRRTARRTASTRTQPEPRPVSRGRGRAKKVADTEKRSLFSRIGKNKRR